MLINLTSRLPENLLPVAFDIASAIQDDWNRASALGALAPHLPTTLLPVTLEAVCALQNEENQARELGALAPHLPATLLPVALAMARVFQDEERRVNALTALAPHVVDALQPSVSTEALEAARAIQHDGYRASALEALAPLLVIHYGNPITNNLAHWYTTIHILAKYGRPGLLDSLAALTPWLSPLAGPEVLTEVAQSLIDVSHYWP